ncbi:flagellar hook-associated protein FlgK [Lachnospiraceae bacterium WCA-9-b2]|jgi:flagellar hook-associated protein 1 FlgK|uniref:Flagellar hook-associated protein 1 n=1 Tax=Sporofaciens musculi TaxID=2681861 RepID=A0A7X3MCW3_9FIRM|nr:flagellar hook-associated protein FlgK [Sporofaciens musculi]MXP73952.1 flagellar hook-associated protein FlgK [Sporofaciens musculi]
MIRSTFAGFTTAQLGMAASQRALDVVGQNITNINTPGYTKQRLDLASLNTQKGDFYNAKSNIKVGFGVEITGISQLRDPFLDAQYRSQISKLGTTDAHAAGFEQLTPIFDEATMDGVRAAFISLTSSLSTLSTQVGNQEHDTMVRSNMQILLNLFRENSVKLQDVREDMQMGFEVTDIADLNSMLKNISELNTSIKNSQVLGNPALELQDQRNQLLDELGSYLPISVKYKNQEVGPGQYVEILNVDFTDTEGVKHSLISDGLYGQFDADVLNQPVQLTLFEAKGATSDVTEVLGSGTLKGTLDFLNKSGDFDGTDFKGLGYYEKVLDSLVNTLATKFNEANVVLDENGKPTNLLNEDGSVVESFDKDGKPIYAIDPKTGDLLDGTNGNAKVYAYPLFETSDGSTEFTAANIKIATGWSNGSYGIRPSNNYVTVDKDTGSTANENILNMVKLLEKDISFSAKNSAGKDITFYKGSFHDCFANIEATLGIDYKSANTMLANQISVLNETANSRDAVSGVQLDEEGMDLLHYNQSYSAAARFLTTLDEALDKLINGTGVVGR